MFQVIGGGKIEEEQVSRHALSYLIPEVLFTGAVVQQDVATPIATIGVGSPIGYQEFPDQVQSPQRLISYDRKKLPEISSQGMSQGLLVIGIIGEVGLVGVRSRHRLPGPPYKRQ